MGRLIVEYAFGDVYALDGLNMQEKEIVAVAQLTALGIIPQLKVHLHSILNVGVAPEEVKEILLQMAVYCGFPKSLNALFALKEILASSEQLAASSPADEFDRHNRGACSLNALHPGQTEVLKEQYGDFLPQMSEWTVDFAFGDIYSRPGLCSYKRQLATVAALSALGNASSQLKFHLGGALKAGITEEALKTMEMLTTVYSEAVSK